MDVIKKVIDYVYDVSTDISFNEATIRNVVQVLAVNSNGSGYPTTQARWSSTDNKNKKIQVQ